MKAIALLILSGSLMAADPETIPEILDKQASWAFSDGASVYIFEKGGKFSLEPLGMSGRTISGTWKTLEEKPEAGYRIEGNWGWINGISPLDDHREMIIDIYPSLREDTSHQKAWRIYKCEYFQIESIRKL